MTGQCTKLHAALFCPGHVAQLVLMAFGHSCCALLACIISLAVYMQEPEVHVLGCFRTSACQTDHGTGAGK